MTEKPEEQKWIIRPVNHHDYNDITDISKDIWDGNDYLPKVFFEWLDAPGLFLGVEEPKQHKVVAVEKYSYLPDKTGWLEGLRVHVSYRNLGLSKIISQALFEKALEDLQSCKVLRIASCTHASNTISIHLSQLKGFVLKQRYLVVEATKQKTDKHISVKSWHPTFQEVQNQPFFQKTHNFICQSFMVQLITKEWFEDLEQRVHFGIIGESPGWVDPSVEPYVQVLNPTPASVVAWLEYGLQVLQTNNCLTYLYPEVSLIESLKSLPVTTWMNYEPDCLYFVYQP